MFSRGGGKGCFAAGGRRRDEALETSRGGVRGPDGKWRIRHFGNIFVWSSGFKDTLELQNKSPALRVEEIYFIF